MSENQKRLLFLCAHRSVRELMAVSLLAAQIPTEWDIWVASAPFAVEDAVLVRQVLEEIHVPFIFSPQTAEPLFTLSWDEGIVLCSGVTDQ